MKRDVMIHIKGIQKVEDQKDVTELYTLGNYYHQNGKYYITYEESEATGYQGSKTTLKVDGNDRVILMRSGKSRSHLIAQTGARNIGLYMTEAGGFEIGVSARKIDSHLTEQGGKLYLSYALDINTSLLSENELFVNITEQKKSGRKTHDQSNHGSKGTIK